jgi:hypothetical protein
VKDNHGFAAHCRHPFAATDFAQDLFAMGQWAAGAADVARIEEPMMGSVDVALNSPEVEMADVGPELFAAESGEGDVKWAHATRAD